MNPDLVAELEGHGITASAGPEVRRKVGRAQHAVWQLSAQAQDATALGDHGQAELFREAAETLRGKLILEIVEGGSHG